MTERDIGVPGALSQALGRLAERVAPASMDRVWIFPPLTQGRAERGLVAAGCFVEGGRRLLVTLAYRAEETGEGITFRPHFQEEGEAPEDRLPRIMEGVVKRSAQGLDAPRSVSIRGEPSAFQALMEELTPAGGPAHHDRDHGTELAGEEMPT